MSDASAGPDLAGKRALVTGGTKGIGAATAVLLQERGAQVIVSARTAPARAIGSARFVAADLATPDGPRQLAAEVLDSWGGLDILIDNAGDQTVRTSVAEFTDDDWERDVQLNLMGAVRLDRALLGALVEAQGAVVHVSSTVARTPEPAVVAYAAAKAALAVYSKALAKQLGPQGVRVNAVFPGFTATEMFLSRFRSVAEEQGRSYDEFVPELMQQMRVPLGRPADPSEVAAAIVFLASPAAGYVTGSQLMVEGGVYPGVF